MIIQSSVMEPYLHHEKWINTTTSEKILASAQTQFSCIEQLLTIDDTQKIEKSSLLKQQLKNLDDSARDTTKKMGLILEQINELYRLQSLSKK